MDDERLIEPCRVCCLGLDAKLVLLNGNTVIVDGAWYEVSERIKRLLAYSERETSMELLTQMVNEYSNTSITTEENPLIKKPYLRGRNKKHKRFF